MKNRKLLVMLGITTLALSVFVGCSSSSSESTEDTTIESTESTESQETEENETAEEVSEETEVAADALLIDGTYRIAYEEKDEAGLETFLEVTVKDGEMEEVTFDEVGENAEADTEDDATDAVLESALLTATTPEEFEEMIKDAEEGEEFKVLVAKLVEQMQEGNTNPLIISKTQNN